MQDARRKTIPLRKSLFLAPAAVLALIPGFNNAIALAQNPADQSASHDSLKAGFENPPNSARPRVWWHWMNGNITQEGIKLDLEWMHRVKTLTPLSARRRS
jgi:hypothetical protein